MQVPREAPQAALDQGGVFTRPQALAEGWTPRQVHLLTQRRDWSRAAGTALTTATALPLDAEALAWSAALTWPGAVVSHLTAAQLHGFPVAGSPVGQVISARGLRRAHLLRAFESALDQDEVTTSSGLVLTSRARTAIDCLALLDAEQGLDLWAWLSTHGVLTRTALAEATRARVGRPGVRRLVRLLELTRSGAVSAAELRLHALVAKAGIRGWRANVEVRDTAGLLVAVVDLLFEREQVAVEVDGWRSHAGRDAFVRDARRQNRLQELGYDVLRFTWDDLVDRPHVVVAQITRALERRRAATTSPKIVTSGGS